MYSSFTSRCLVLSLTGALLIGMAGCYEDESSSSQSKAKKTGDCCCACDLTITNDSFPLYDRLGGDATMAKVVDDFVNNVLADEHIPNVTRDRLRDSDLAKIKADLIKQIRAVTTHTVSAQCCEAVGETQACKDGEKDCVKVLQFVGFDNIDGAILHNHLQRAMASNNVNATARTEFTAMLPPRE